MRVNESGKLGLIGHLQLVWAIWTSIQSIGTRSLPCLKGITHLLQLKGFNLDFGSMSFFIHFVYFLITWQTKNQKGSSTYFSFWTPSWEVFPQTLLAASVWGLMFLKINKFFLFYFFCPCVKNKELFYTWNVWFRLKKIFLLDVICYTERFIPTQWLVLPLTSIHL